MQLEFGAGALFGERTDVQIGTTGGNGAVQLGVLQSCEITFEFTKKPLYGGNQFPIALGRGEGKVTGTAKFARFSSKIWSDLAFGTAATVSPGQLTMQLPETQTTAISVTVNNAATYKDDLGVFYYIGYGVLNGIALARVASAPAQGQYSVDYTTGVYTFNTADVVSGPPAGQVQISYLYTATAGKQIQINNVPMGYTPTFKGTFFNNYNGSGLTLRLNQCIGDKISIPTKYDDWTISDFGFDAVADASGIIGTLSMVE